MTIWTKLIVTCLLSAFALVLAACGEDRQPDTVTWRNIDIDLPHGWYVFEQEADRLSISNVDLAWHAEEGTFPEEDVVAMFFTYEPATLPDDWRQLLDDLDAEVEVDDRLELHDEIPATRLVFRYVSAQVPTRELVALIPSRNVVVLAQPVPRPGQQDAPELFLEYVGVFMDVLETAQLGRPVLE